MSHVHQPYSLPLIAVVAAAYVVMAVRQGPRGWSSWRTTSFLVACALLVVAVLPGASPYPDGDLRGHMLQHLVIGMFAPTGLVLGAPVTLVLRTAGPRGRRVIGRIMRSRLVHVLTRPVVALTANVGGLVALYGTDLHRSLPHSVVHLHFLAAGYLFAWVIAGPDPAPDRPSVPQRLFVLGVAITAHAVLSQLMYAGVFVTITAPAHQVRGAAELMYYGGDIAELLLAFALVTAWRPERRRRTEGVTGCPRG